MGYLLSSYWLIFLLPAVSADAQLGVAGTLLYSGCYADARRRHCRRGTGSPRHRDLSERRARHSALPHQTAGRGAGLAIVSMIVDRHGGKIAVESEAGKQRCPGAADAARRASRAPEFTA